jgi:hypothetical protein
MPKVKIVWLTKPQNHDYPAAESYLNLLFDAKKAGDYIQKLKKAPIVEFKAKDIFRASGLSLLGPSNYHVQADRKRIVSKEKLSPLLLVRDQKNSRTIIADGYHRICAVYSYDEDAVIPCKIV